MGNHGARRKRRKNRKIGKYEKERGDRAEAEYPTIERDRRSRSSEAALLVCRPSRENRRKLQSGLSSGDLVYTIRVWGSKERAKVVGRLYDERRCLSVLAAVETHGCYVMCSYCLCFQPNLIYIETHVAFFPFLPICHKTLALVT